MSSNAPEYLDQVHQQLLQFYESDKARIQKLERCVRSLSQRLKTSEKEKSMLHDPVHPLDKANEAKLEELKKQLEQLDYKIELLENDCSWENEIPQTLSKLHSSIQRGKGKQHIDDLEFCVQRLKALQATQAEIDALITELEERFEHALWLNERGSEDSDDDEPAPVEWVFANYSQENDQYIPEQTSPSTSAGVMPPPDSTYGILLRKIEELIEEAPWLRAGTKKFQEENLALHKEVEKLKSDSPTTLLQEENSKLQEELNKSNAENVTLRMQVQELEEQNRSNRERNRKLRKPLEDFVQRAPDMQHKGVTKTKVSQAFGALADVVKEVREWLQEL